MPGHRFVAFLQNHDQIGNRAVGDRLSALLSPGLLKVGATLLLTSPFTPMLFMGEEWAASSPWQFFTSHPEPELAAAVQNGRRREFAAHGWAEADVPDPQDRATFERSKLDWAEKDKPGHAEIFDLHRRLIAIRRQHADLTNPWLDKVEVWHGDQYVVIRRGGCVVAANLAAGAADGEPARGAQQGAAGHRAGRGAAARPGRAAAGECRGGRRPLRTTRSGDRPGSSLPAEG